MSGNGATRPTGPAWRKLVAAAMTALLGAPAAGSSQEQGRVQPVPTLDLTRYMGRWHEVARFPNSFQRRCATETTAEYELRADGQVRVVNRCRTVQGDTLRAEGRARLADRSGPASRLKVRFAPALLSFLPFVWGDYWVLDLTDDYGAALVGTPNRRYLWVLSRGPTLDDATYQRLVDTAVAQGFDVTRLVRSAAK